MTGLVYSTNMNRSEAMIKRNNLRTLGWDAHAVWCIEGTYAVIILGVHKDAPTEGPSAITLPGVHTCTAAYDIVDAIKKASGMWCKMRSVATPISGYQIVLHGAID